MGYDVPMQAEQIAPSNTYPLDDIKFVNIPVIGSVAAGRVVLLIMKLSDMNRQTTMT